MQSPAAEMLTPLMKEASALIKELSSDYTCKKRQILHRVDCTPICTVEELVVKFGPNMLTIIYLGLAYSLRAWERQQEDSP